MSDERRYRLFCATCEAAAPLTVTMPKSAPVTAEMRTMLDYLFRAAARAAHWAVVEVGEGRHEATCQGCRAHAQAVQARRGA